MGNEHLCYALLLVLVAILGATVRNGWVMTAIAKVFAAQVAAELKRLADEAIAVAAIAAEKLAAKENPRSDN